jgi:hypothetical protein
MEPGEVTLSAPAETDDRLGGFAALYRDRYVPMVRLSVLLVDRVELAEEVRAGRLRRHLPALG